MSDLTTVILVTTIAGLATGLGAIPVFFRAHISHRIYDSSLGLAAGIMLAASVFALIVPGIEVGTLSEVIVGIVLGVFGLLLANKAIPHIHARYQGWSSHGPQPDTDPRYLDRLRRAVLIGGAIALHNAPEGLAIGVAFASGLEGVGIGLAIIIGLQNIPDGFAFAVPIEATGISKWYVLVYTTLSGLVPQVTAAVIGFALVNVVTGLFPIAAGFAAGAMMAVIFREMIPSSHGHGYADAATTAFVIGFILVMIIDHVLVF